MSVCISPKGLTVPKNSGSTNLLAIQTPTLIGCIFLKIPPDSQLRASAPRLFPAWLAAISEALDYDTVLKTRSNFFAFSSAAEISSDRLRTPPPNCTAQTQPLFRTASEQPLCEQRSPPVYIVFPRSPELVEFFDFRAAGLTGDPAMLPPGRNICLRCLRGSGLWGCFGPFRPYEHLVTELRPRALGRGGPKVG